MTVRGALLIADDGVFGITERFQRWNARVFLERRWPTHHGDVRRTVGREAVLLDVISSDTRTPDK